MRVSWFCGSLTGPDDSKAELLSPDFFFTGGLAAVVAVAVVVVTEMEGSGVVE